VKQFTRVRPESEVAQRITQALPDTASRLDRVHVMAAVLALGLTTYLAVEPTQNWLLLLLCGLAALGTDAVVRNHPRAHFDSIDDTALYLFVPVLFTLSVGIFLEDVVSGYWTLGFGLASVIPFWAILRSEYESIDRDSDLFETARLALNGATYLVAFLFFATVYDFELSLFASSLTIGIVSVLLAIEVLREEGLNTARTIQYSFASGILMAEAAWTTHFLPMDGSAAAVFVLLAFYLMTGLMHNYLGNRLNLKTAAEFAAVALCGLVIITVANSSL
jgi:hypothetical protein